MPSLIERPRRLRQSVGLRRLVREVSLGPGQLILPLFVHELDLPTPIVSMPGVQRHSLQSALEQVDQARQRGLGGVMLFGIPQHKDEGGSGAYADDGIVQRATRGIKQRWPDYTVLADTCLCEYTSHGHCGPLASSCTVDNDAALELLARTAVSQAVAGADIVAPSAMMDGQVAAIRAALDRAGYPQTLVMSYAVKYASAYYGPFRDAAGSAPARGDRQSYQMDPAGGYREALREARLDAEQGADFLMVKPALAYLDVLRVVRDQFDLPLVAYNVSGEYAMVKAAAQAGFIDERRVVLETLIGLRRAGADAIISYHALEVAGWLQEP